MATAPYAPYPFPYPNQSPPPSSSYHAAAYHNHHSLQLPPPSYPHPAATYPPGFVPVPANTTPIHHHRPGFVPSPAYWPPPAPDPPTSEHVPVHHNSSGCPIHSLHHHHFPPTSDQLLVHAVPQPNAAPTAPNPSRNHRFFMEDDAVVQAVAEAHVPADEHVPAKDATHHRLQRELLNIQARLDQQHAQEKSALDAIQGKLAQLTAMASQLAVSIGKCSTSAHNSTPTASASSASFLAPHVFGEMPTPISGHGTQSPPKQTSAASLVTPLNPASVTPVQSTFVADENNNLTEQHPYEEDCFTKSEQQPQHGSSIGFCTVLPTNLIIQQDREGKQKTEDTSNYFTKKIFSPERVVVCSGSVFSLKIEEIICDSEKMNDSDNQFLAKQHMDQLLHCSSTALQCSTYEEECQGDVNILWVKSVCQTSTGNSISFYQWDPGASTPLHSSKFGTYVQQPRDPSWNAVIVPERRTEWDPGDTKLHDLFSVAAVAKKIPRTHAYKCVRVQILVGQFGASRKPSFTCATMHPYAFGLGCTRVNALVLIVLAVQGSTGRSVAKPLLFLANDGNSSIKHSSPKLFMHIYLDTRAMQTFPWLQNPLLTDLQCQLPMFNSSELLQHMVIVLSCWWPSFEMAKLQWDPGIATPSSIYLWLPSLTARIATKKPLSRVPIPEPTQWQSQVTSASFVCDPGTRLLLHKSKWWFVYTEDMTNWYTNIKFNGVALWLFHSLPP